MPRPVTLVGVLVLILFPAPAARAATLPVWCHEVRPGDTLDAIARRHGTSVEDLRGLNRLAPRAVPRLRRILMLPAVAALRGGRLDLSRPPLIAGPHRLSRESAAAGRDRLSRMGNLATVERFRRSGLLVDVPLRTPTYRVDGVDPRLRALIRTNPSAAPAAGPVQSTHLTGAAVDISKRALSEREVAWLRTVIARLEARRLIHAVEEFGEPHFHVLIRRAYAPYARTLGSAILTGGC